MSNVAEMIEKTVAGTIVHGQSEYPLRDAVRHALDNYFAQLAGEKPTDLYKMVLEQIELPVLEIVMKYTGGNQSRAAKILGLSRGTLRKMLKTYDLL